MRIFAIALNPSAGAVGRINNPNFFPPKIRVKTFGYSNAVGKISVVNCLIDVLIGKQVFD